MFEDLEEQSKNENKWYYHPKIDFIVFCGKKYRCIIHRKLRMNKGNARQHVEGTHNIDFDTGKESKITENLPELPPSTISVSSPKQRKSESYERDETNDGKHEKNEKPPLILTLGGTQMFSRCLRSSAIDYSVLKSPKPFPQPTSWEPKDEWDEKIEMWQKIRKLKAMGYPKDEINKLMKKYGFVKEEKKREYTPAEIELVRELLKKNR